MSDYSRFTDRARKVMQLANQEAQRLGHNYLCASHIFIGLCKEGNGVAAKVFERLRLDASRLMNVMRTHLTAGMHFEPGRLPHTPSAKKVVDSAIVEAKNVGHNYVGTEHLLLGLLSYSGTIGTLAAFGVTESMARESLVALWADWEKDTAPKAEEPQETLGELIKRWHERLAKQKQQAARLEPPPGLVHAIHSEPLVAAVWAEAERAGLTREGALTAVALELLADNVRYRRAEVERQMGWLRMPRAEATPVGPPVASHVASYFAGYASSPGVPTVVESAP